MSWLSNSKLALVVGAIGGACLVEAGRYLLRKTRKPTKQSSALCRYHACVVGTTECKDVTKGSSSRESKRDATAASDLLDFCLEIGQLKHVPRTGWLMMNLPEWAVESVADHSWRMAMMAWTFARRMDTSRACRYCNLRTDSCTLMALVHDVAEARVGDFTPADGVSKSEKAKMERTAMEQMWARMGHAERDNASSPGSPMDVWETYENRACPESVFVKQIDVLDMAIEALRYEMRYHVDLTEFYEYCRDYITDPLCAAVMKEIGRRRSAFDFQLRKLEKPPEKFQPQTYETGNSSSGVRKN